MMEFERDRYPDLPGVYIMRDKGGQVIYIGKASSLRKRLGQYFSRRRGPKTDALMSKADSIDFTITSNEAEALLMESALIKTHQPMYNMVLKDAKHFSYLAITDEDHPRLIVARKNSKGRFRIKARRFFGPFIEGAKRACSARFLRKLFRIRTCKRMPKKECLQYHIGNCDGPCIGKISRDEYMENVSSLCSVLEGKGARQLISSLDRRMRKASDAQDYELARSIHEQMGSLEIFLSRQEVERPGGVDEDYLWFERIADDLHVQILESRDGLIRRSSKSCVRMNRQEDPEISFCLQYYPDAPSRVYSNLTSSQIEALNRAFNTKAFRRPGAGKGKVLDIARKSLVHGKVAPSVLRLKEALGLRSNPIVIEAFDISTLLGKDSVGSMVRFVNGKPDKPGYRRFLIRTVDGQDDYSMMREVVRRRYVRLRKEGSPLPDLVLIDGGPGQLRSALDAIAESGLIIPAASIAKKEEEIFVPSEGDAIRLPRRDAGLMLLQHCRDEAHRFAVNYHRRRRS